MGDMTPNLSRKEFACQCGCGYDTVDYDLPDVIQNAVYHFQDKHQGLRIHVKINSGTRCETHNTNVGGSMESQHLYGKAADIVIYDGLTDTAIPASKVADYFERIYPRSHGIGRYNGRTHIDVREPMARWDVTTDEDTSMHEKQWLNRMIHKFFT